MVIKCISNVDIIYVNGKGEVPCSIINLILRERHSRKAFRLSFFHQFKIFSFKAKNKNARTFFFVRL